MLRCKQRGKLCQPGRGFCEEDLNDRAGLRTAAQAPQRMEHRTVGFLASIPFDALTVRHVNGPLAKGDLTLEFLGQRGLAYPRLPGDEDDLSRATEGAPPRLMQNFQCARASHQVLHTPCGYGGSRVDDFGHLGDKSVAALVYRLDEKGILRVVPKRA